MPSLSMPSTMPTFLLQHKSQAIKAGCFHSFYHTAWWVLQLATITNLYLADHQQSALSSPPPLTGLGGFHTNFTSMKDTAFPATASPPSNLDSLIMPIKPSLFIIYSLSSSFLIIDSMPFRLHSLNCGWYQQPPGMGVEMFHLHSVQWVLPVWTWYSSCSCWWTLCSRFVG